MPSHLSSSGSGGGGGSYTLPTASSSVLGGVKVGAGLSVDGSGVLSAALVKLDEVVVGSGGAATIAFSGIAQTYRTLQLVMQARADVAATSTGALLQINGDTAGHYDWGEIYGLNNVAGSDGAAAATSIKLSGLLGASAPAGAAGLCEVLLANYAGTTFRKSLRAVCQETRDALDTGQVSVLVTANWRSSAAITSLLITPQSGSFVAGSTATLYALG